MKTIILLLISLCLALTLQAQVTKTAELTPGSLITELTTDELKTITHLTLTGTMDARDFKTLRDSMPSLAMLELSEATVAYYFGVHGTRGAYETGYPANAIPSYAFYDSSSESGKLSLTEVILPSTITSIEDGAFIRCIHLTTINLPLSVNTLGYAVFADCTSLTGLTLHAELTNIGMNAFWGCGGEINVDANHPNFTSLEGVLFNKESTTLLHYPSLRSGSYTIPSTVTTLEDGAFWGCKSIQSVTLPETLTKMGGMAFYGCRALTSLKVNTPYPLDLSEAYDVFWGVNTSACELQVPYGAKANYLAAEKWNNFATIVEADNGFLLSSTSHKLKASGESYSTLQVQSTVEWTAAADQSWFSISPDSGTGTQALTILAEANPNVLTRSAIITFTSTGFPPQILTVMQEGLPETIVVTPGRLSSIDPVYLSQISHLSLTGTMDARDFKILRDGMPQLTELDLSRAAIVAYEGTEGTIGDFFESYNEATIPPQAFSNSENETGKRGLTTVILPSSLVGIGYFAFNKCENLSSIVLPDKVRNIDYNAFGKCNSLASINIPAPVESIDPSAFIECSALFQVDPANINYSSHEGVLLTKDQTILIQCPTSKAGEYRIPSTVNTIGYNAFISCSNLTNLVIPPLINSLENVSFYRCSALFTVDNNNPFYSSMEGVLYNKDRTLLVKFPESKTGSMVIPSSVTAIIDGAFYACKGITSVTIPLSVKGIGESAFEECIALTSLIVYSPHPIDLSKKYNVFEGINTSHCLLYVPYGAGNFYAAAPGWEAFTNIEEEPDGFIVSAYSLRMNSEGGNDSTISIKANVAWRADSEQPWLTVDPASGTAGSPLIFTIQPNTMVGFRTATVTFSAKGYPSQSISISQEGVTKTVNVTAGYLNRALQADELNGLTHLTITGTMDARDFRFIRDEMPALAVLDLSDATIEGYQGDGGTAAYIQDYLPHEIPSYAFCDNLYLAVNAHLRNVLFPSNLRSIGSSAFKSCTGLTSVILPASITIGSEAFSQCTGLQSIFVKASYPIDLSGSYYVFYDVDKNKCVLHVPYKTKELYAVADQWREFVQILEDTDGFILTSTILNLPAESSMGSMMLTANKSWMLSSDQPWLTVSPAEGSDSREITFSAIANPMVTRRTAIVTVSATDEESQTIMVHQMGIPLKIDVTAGKLMTALTPDERVNISQLIVTGTIDARDFKTIRDEMPLLTMLDLSGATIRAYTGTEGTSGITYEPVEYPANTVPEYAFYNNNLGQSKTGLKEIVLPTSATGISHSVFFNCIGLSSVIIPSTVSTIGEYAFYGCKSLTSLELPTLLTSISRALFLECNALEDIVIPPLVTSIGDNAFRGCQNLTSILVPSGITSVGNESFMSCYNLAAVSLPMTLMTIGSGAFWGCQSLTSLELPSSVLSIGESAFSSCHNLASVNLPPLITSIERHTFSGCSSLTSIMIPSLVTTIGDNAFSYCEHLETVDLPPSVTIIEPNAFLGCRSITSIILPSKVSSIGSKAFSYCTGLSSVYAYGAIPVDLTMSPEVFLDVDTYNCKLFVRYKAGELYAAADQWEDFRNIVEEPSGFKLDSTNLSFPAEGGTLIVKSTANITWTAVSSHEWLTIDPATGTGDQAISFTAQANTTVIMRKALVTVSATGVSTQIIAITQPGLPKTISLTAGGLFSALTAEEMKGITQLIVTGRMDARDFKTIRDEMHMLTWLDLSGATIVAYSGPDGTADYDYAYMDNQVPMEAFYSSLLNMGNTTLTYLRLPSNLTSIGIFAFNACIGLTSLIIPSSVTIIEPGAFANCSNLTALYSNPKVPVDLSNSFSVFEGINKAGCTLHVPAGSLALYKTAYQWQDFYNMVEDPVGVEDGMESIAQIKCYPNPFNQQITIDIQNPSYEKMTVDIYNLAGQRVKNLANGNNSSQQSLTWDGTNEQGKQAVPGVYVLRINGQVRKVVKR